MVEIEEIDPEGKLEDNDAACELEDNNACALEDNDACELEYNEDSACALEDNEACELEDSGACALKDNEAACPLEDSASVAEPTGTSPDQPVLEDNDGSDDDDDDDDDDEWEIPYAEKEEGPETDTFLEVRLHREGNQRLGLVLDEQNCVVMLRENTPAAICGEIEVGDEIVELQGVMVSRERRVATLLRELPDAAVYVLKIKRPLSEREMKDHLEHGPLMTQEEIEQFQVIRAAARRTRAWTDTSGPDERGTERRRLELCASRPPPNLSFGRSARRT